MNRVEPTVPHSDQLDLWQEELDASPWGGRSPRSLTRVALGFIFEARAAKDERFFVDPDQLRFSFLGDKAPWKYQGAPLLREV